jgi:hypothetical protein
MVCGVGSGLLYSGYTSFKMHQMDERISEFYEDPSPEVFSRFIGDNRHYYNPAIFDLVDAFSRNPNDDTLIQRAKDNMMGVRDLQANIPMVGASGALFGVLIAFGMLFPNTQLFLLFPPMPVKAKYLVLFYGLYTVYSIINNNPMDNVAHFAHLSGLIIGAAMIYYWKSSRKDFY